jgi:hypothetical protein
VPKLPLPIHEVDLLLNPLIGAALFQYGIFRLLDFGTAHLADSHMRRVEFLFHIGTLPEEVTHIIL